MSEVPDDQPPTADDDLVAERLPLIDLENSSTSQPPPRKRIAQIVMVLLALIVASAVLWNSIGPDKHPQPQPGEPLTRVSALLVSNVTNATITLNGKKLAGPLPQVVSVYLQTAEVTITAPLFRPHTCHFQGLLTKTDTTHCLFTIEGGQELNGTPYVIGAFLTPDDLLPAQQNQVMAPITQELAQTQQSTVQPGDYIATTFDTGAVYLTSQHAAAPLQASATFVQGPTLSSRSFPYISSCAQLICPAGFGPAHPEQAGQVWDVLLNVMLRWRFMDASGATIADVTYPPDPLAFRQPSLLLIQYVYDSTGWHLAAGTDLNAEMQTILCGNGGAILDQRLQALQFFDSNGSETTSDQSAAGCLLSVKSDTKGSGTFLWRFGVLLAADKGAHSILPDLPMAPQAEIAAASA